jgi:NADH-ubiquinone oxidoreductase chain 2
MNTKNMLLTLLVLLLLSNAVTSNKDKSILYSRAVILSLLFIILLLIDNLYVSPLITNIGIYGGLFNITIVSHALNIFIYFVSATILTLTAFYPRKINLKGFSNIFAMFSQKLIYDKNIISNKTGEQFRIIEYALIIVFILSGAMFLISTADLVSIFLAIELQSYGLYILSTLYRDSEVATGSGLTYFLLGGLSSCFILLGSALLYSNTGTTSLDNIYIINNICNVKEIINFQSWYDSSFMHLCLIIMVTGFLFKVSAAPFHFWSPDVYDGIPTIVTTFVAIIAKISIFGFLLGLVYYTESDHADFSWKNILMLSSLFSLIIGSVLGLTQSRIKRLFAYSTISHVGFILLALSITTTESIQSYIFYILQYSLANLNAFVILITIGYTLYFYSYKENSEGEKLIDQNNSPIQFINQIKGYFHINPYLAISLSITLFSFVGVPPLMGFFAKQMILSSALDNGYIFMTLVAIITSVIGAGYYLNLIKQIFFYKSDYVKNTSLFQNDNSERKNNNKLVALVLSRNNSGLNSDKFNISLTDITVNSSLSGIISILTLLLIVFIFIPMEWFNIITILTIN